MRVSRSKEHENTSRVCLLSCSLLLLPGCGGKKQKTAATTEGNYTVGFLMETYDLDRWKRDESFFGNRSRSLGMTVFPAVADADQNRQNKQAETLLTQGVNVLVVAVGLDVVAKNPPP